LRNDLLVTTYAGLQCERSNGVPGQRQLVPSLSSTSANARNAATVARALSVHGNEFRRAI
jgi:hypothetical protein